MLKTLHTWLLCLLLAATLSSCIYDDIADEATPPGQTVTLKFDIHTGDVRSRALGVWDENHDLTAERILNVSDMRVLLFTQAGRLIQTLTPASLDYIGQSASNDGYYSLALSFSNDYFDRYLEADRVPFHLMILANLEGAGGQYLSYPADMLQSGVADSFRLPDDYFPTNTIGIPMYGYKYFEIAPKDMIVGSDAAGKTVGEIDLIRGLCKIEVADKIANAIEGPDGLKYPHVTDVEMISRKDRGYIRPRSDSYADGLTTANIYPSDPVTTPISATRVGDGFRFYTPEADLKDVRFRVTALLTPGGEPRQYEIGLDQVSGIGSQLVRNHIYTFDVHALNTVADLHVKVADWQVEVDEFELNNIVSMEPDGFLKWSYDDAVFSVSTETYRDKPEQQLSILGGTNQYATGSFHIISPRGATWQAYFIPGENGVDAFEFVDVDADGRVISGSESVYASGAVGERATIHIRGKGPADAFRHYAELVVIVRTADGAVLSTPLTPQMSTRFIIYRENRM